MRQDQGEGISALAAAVEADPSDRTVAEAVVDAITARVKVSDGFGKSDAALDSLIDWAIERSADELSPLPLHTRLANLHLGNVAGVLDKAAMLFRPVIERRLAAGEPSRNMILMLLLLRDSVDWLDGLRLRTWHIDGFASFRYIDLAIPYNLMFEPKRFRGNRSDLLEASRAGLLPQLPAAHWLFLSWLLGEEPAVSRIATATSEEDTPDGAAARSILLRHGDDSDDLAREMERRRATLSDQTRRPGTAGRAEARLANRPRQAISALRSLAGTRAPFIARSWRRPKVAFCISGQLRGYQAAFATWRRTLFHGVEAHIFVHSWKRIGRSGAEPFRYVLPFEGERFVSAYRQACMPIGVEAFETAYPTLFRRLAATGVVDEATLSSFYGTPHVHLDDETEAPFADWSNQQKMHRKIAAAHDMAKLAGEEFDLVVRTRPDRPVRYLAFDWPTLLAAARERPVLFADRAMGVQYGLPMIGDQFAVGIPTVMDAYAAAADLHDRFAARRLLGYPAELTGHVSLAQCCWLQGIDVRRALLASGPLQDPAKLQASEIADALKIDAAGRMDETDRRLIAAIEADLAHSR